MVCYGVIRCGMVLGGNVFYGVLWYGKALCCAVWYSKDDVAKEGRPKFNPRPGRRLNPGPFGWK